MFMFTGDDTSFPATLSFTWSSCARVRQIFNTDDPELMRQAIMTLFLQCKCMFFFPSKQILKGVVSFVEVAAPERHVCKGKTD